MKKIYDRTVRELFDDFLKERKIKKDEAIKRLEIQEWFKKKYPKIKPNTVNCHITRLSTNIPSRIYYIKEGATTDDLFFSLPDSSIRLFDKQNDPPPIYYITGKDVIYNNDNYTDEDGSKEFAYEKDLRDYLAKNLSIIEQGLKLYEEDDITGIEYDAGGRRIDILCLDKDENYVVLELKVSRGYDRVIGQILRYMNWVEENLMESNQKVRGIIICRESTEDLLLACKNIKNIEVYSYELNIKLSRKK